MVSPYKNAHDFYQVCQNAFSTYYTEGQQLYPHGQVSHLCIRTFSDDDYILLKTYGETLGQVTGNQKENSALAFVKLNQPLTHQQAELNWLEITAPKAEHPFTAPQMLIFAGKDEGKEVQPASDQSGFALRWQSLSAVQILGL